MSLIPKSKFTWILIIVLLYGYVLMKGEQEEYEPDEANTKIKSSIEGVSFFEKPASFLVDQIQNTDLGRTMFDAVVQHSVQSKYGEGDISASLAQEKGRVVLFDQILGEGISLQCNSVATIHFDSYVGDAVKFYSTYKKKKPIIVNMQKNQVPKGLKIGLLGMKKGGKRIIGVPSTLAYDDPRFSNDLVQEGTPILYEVELVKIKNGLQVDDVMSSSIVGDGVGKVIASCGDKVKIKYSSGNNSGVVEFKIGDGTAPIAFDKALVGLKEGAKIMIKAPQTLLVLPAGAIDLPGLTASGKGIVDIVIEVINITES